MISAQDALDRLQEGNLRFSSDHTVSHTSSRTLNNQNRRDELLAGQEPFAIIVGCSDSRVPAEIIFDQGLGDLFVVRVAGNIVAPSQVGSIELAATGFGTPLVVVLGHSGCGAVQATLAELKNPSENLSPNLRAIIDRIRPSMESELGMDLRQDSDALVRNTIQANIRAAVHHLRHESQILKELIQYHGLLVVGAEYSLETGVVDFLDDLPEAG